jgi:hypothetical protein
MGGLWTISFCWDVRRARVGYDEHGAAPTGQLAALLADGWEPFGVVGSSQGYADVFLRRMQPVESVRERVT